MKKPQAITVAMMRNPAGEEWQGQIQLEYIGERGKQVVNVRGDNPFDVFERAKTLLARKFIVDNASQ